MSSARSPKLGKRLGGSALGFLLFACCHSTTPIVVVAPDGSIVKVEQPGKPPCGLSKQTKLAVDPKLVERLGTYKYAGTTPDQLDAHCRTVWQEVVEARRCGRVAIPRFCETCGDEAEKSRCLQGNGRGLVMQNCREATLAEFTQNYPTCGNFTLCASKLQEKTIKCEAGRM